MTALRFIEPDEWADWRSALDRDADRSNRTWDRHRLNLALAVDEHRDLERAEAFLDVIAAGSWGRWFVRGALDPSYAAAGDRDAMVRALSRRGRWADAAALIRGWVRRG